MKKYNYENLDIYQLSVELVFEVYRITQKFPKEEIFGLTSQLRRAATSVTLNIAEGSTRNSRKDFALFVDRSIGSLVEIRAGLQVSLKLKFVLEQETGNIFNRIDELFFKSQKMKKYLRLEPATSTTPTIPTK